MPAGLKHISSICTSHAQYTEIEQVFKARADLEQVTYPNLARGHSAFQAIYSCCVIACPGCPGLREILAIILGRNQDGIA